MCRATSPYIHSAVLGPSFFSACHLRVFYAFFTQIYDLGQYVTDLFGGQFNGLMGKYNSQIDTVFTKYIFDNFDTKNSMEK